MTSESFNQLQELEKSTIISRAEKIDEQNNGFMIYSLFKIDDLFLEAVTCKDGNFNNNIKAYDLKELPLIYTSKVFAQLGADEQ